MSELSAKLESYLRARHQPMEVFALTADASTREYFRVFWNGVEAVACVYPQANDPAAVAYLDVTELFKLGGLPVADIYDFDLETAITIQEDLGDRVLRTQLEEGEAESSARLLNEAISLIARIQKVTDLAFERHSIASKLRFDKEKLQWELDFFKEHYFQTYRKRTLSAALVAKLTDEFSVIAEELDVCAAVLCHRDFHAANLMLDGHDRMRIIDHQDARIGSAAYDLVSLLLDRITYLPSPEWLSEKRRYFLDVRRKLGLDKIDEEAFAQEFRLQTIQRCLKAAGTFSYQAVNRGKTYFVPFISPMLGISRRAAESLGRFPAVQEVLSAELEAEST